MKNIFINISAKQNIYKNNKLNPIMKKRSALFFGIIILLNFVSAGYYYSSSNSLRSLFDRVEPTTIYIIVAFLISFLIVFYALNKVMDNQKPISGGLAFAVALLISYQISRFNWGYNTSYSLWWSIKDFWQDAGFFSYILIIGITIAFLWIIQVLVIKKQNKKSPQNNNSNQGDCNL